LVLSAVVHLSVHLLFVFGYDFSLIGMHCRV
jgi:hypothetical protein